MLTIRPAVPTDYSQIVALLNATTSRAPTTLEQFIAQEQEITTGHVAVRLLAFLPDGTLAGCALAGEDDEQAPAHFYLSVRVDSAYRRRGIGRALVTQVSDWARAQGAVCLEATYGEQNTAAAAFAAAMGFVTEGRLYRSQLQLAGWHPGACAGAVTAAEAQGFRFVTLAELGVTEPNLRRFHEACVTLVQQVPGRSPLMPPYDRWRSRLDDDDAWDPACVLLVLDGDRWAGLSYMEKQADRAWYSHLTGVFPEYRGRGLGLALKVAAVAGAQADGAPYLTTYNHAANGPMVAINRQLGYKPVETVLQVHLDL